MRERERERERERGEKEREREIVGNIATAGQHQNFNENNVCYKSLTELLYSSSVIARKYLFCNLSFSL